MCSVHRAHFIRPSDSLDFERPAEAVCVPLAEGIQPASYEPRGGLLCPKGGVIAQAGCGDCEEVSAGGRFADVLNAFARLPACVVHFRRAVGGGEVTCFPLAEDLNAPD